LSLARQLKRRGRAAEALTELSAIYERFSEGHETGDLALARAEIQALKPSMS
jgi:hypothetical protein